MCNSRGVVFVFKRVVIYDIFGHFLIEHERELLDPEDSKGISTSRTTNIFCWSYDLPCVLFLVAVWDAMIYLLHNKLRVIR